MAQLKYKNQLAHIGICSAHPEDLVETRRLRRVLRRHHQHRRLEAHMGGSGIQERSTALHLVLGHCRLKQQTVSIDK